MRLYPLIATLLATPALAGGLEDAQGGPAAAEPDPTRPDEGPSAEIINGQSSTEDSYPMTGGMLFSGTLDFGSFGTADVRMFLCSSTLIAPDVVLLAAHCLDDTALTYGFGTVSNKEIGWTRQADLTALDGTTEAMPDWPADTVMAKAWVTHESFDLNGMQTGLATNYDIALLFLERAVTEVPHAYVISTEEATQLQVGTEVAVVGWGQQVASESPFDPPEPGTYAIKMEGMSTIDELGDAEFWVGAEEADVRKCHGDSGGPSFAWVDTESTEAMRIVGVTSHAYDTTDCKVKGGVDTRVDFYWAWIDEQMQAACADGTRVWCDVPGIVPAPDPLPDDGGDDTGVDGEGGDDKGGLFACSVGGQPAGAALVALGALLVARRRR